MRKKIVVLLAVLLLLSQMPVFAGALFEAAGTRNIVKVRGDVDIDRKVSGTVVAVTGNVNVREAVDGDVIAVLGNVTADAEVSGNIVSIFGSVKLSDRARAGGDVLTVMGNTEVAAEVDGGVLSLFGGSSIVDSGRVANDVMTLFGSVKVRGGVNGDITTIFGDTFVDAEIYGSTVSVFGKLTLDEGADIGKDIFAVGPLQKKAGAKIRGREASIDTGALPAARALLLTMTGVLTAAVLTTGLGVLALFKSRADTLTEDAGNGFARKMLLGFLALIGLLLLFFLLLLTVIAPIALFLLFLLAEAAACLCLGSAVLKLLDIKANRYIGFITGVTGLTVVKAAMIIWLQNLGYTAAGLLYLGFTAAVISYGIGILLDTRFGTTVH